MHPTQGSSLRKAHSFKLISPSSPPSTTRVFITSFHTYAIQTWGKATKDQDLMAGTMAGPHGKLIPTSLEVRMCLQSVSGHHGWERAWAVMGRAYEQGLRSYEVGDERRAMLTGADAILLGLSRAERDAVRGESERVREGALRERSKREQSDREQSREGAVKRGSTQG
eukprot:1159674-Pelagomonas_calceolata.AAC.9